MREVHAAASTPGLTAASSAVGCVAAPPLVQPNQVSAKKQPSVSRIRSILAQVCTRHAMGETCDFPKVRSTGAGHSVPRHDRDGVHVAPVGTAIRTSRMTDAKDQGTPPGFERRPRGSAAARLTRAWRDRPAVGVPAGGPPRSASGSTSSASARRWTTESVADAFALSNRQK